MVSIEKSVLVVVDVQGNLARLMHDQERLFHNVRGLIRACRILGIPLIVTEQVPEKIGPTVPEIAEHLSGIKPLPKNTFSCFLCEAFTAELKSYKRKEVIICGIESHVCVYQTVSDLMEHQFSVSVVADAVSSRTSENRMYGLDRMRALGAVITSTEMILMELLRTSAHPKFRDLLGLIK
ncbi:MAG: hydrolase [Candidatus Omnitrophota bacterium]